MDHSIPYYLRANGFDEKEKDIIRGFAGKGYLVLPAVRMYMGRNAGFWCRASDVPRALELFPEIKKTLMAKVVKHAARIGIFDFGLFVKHKILTSVEIQENYFDVIGRSPERSRKLEYDKRYLLVNPDAYLSGSPDAAKTAPPADAAAGNAQPAAAQESGALPISAATELVKKKIGYDKEIKTRIPKEVELLDGFVNLYSRACADPARRKYKFRPQLCYDKTFVALLDKVDAPMVLEIMERVNSAGVNERYHYLCGAVGMATKQADYIRKNSETAKPYMPKTTNKPFIDKAHANMDFDSLFNDPGDPNDQM